ncbi:MAG: peptide transporter, partial [Marinovum sp.]|nr:peptide transporter [Marinovum sp.]
MFESFFPKPKLFFLSLFGWVALLIIFWYTSGEYVGTALGFNLEDTAPVIGLGHFITPQFLWFDTYFLIGLLAFYGFWRYHSPHEWQDWAILGSAL